MLADQNRLSDRILLQLSGLKKPLKSLICLLVLVLYSSFALATLEFESPKTGEKYIATTHLGGGGFAAAYLVRRESDNQMFVAKVFRTELGSDREVEIIRNLKHLKDNPVSNAVQVFEAGVFRYAGDTVVIAILEAGLYTLSDLRVRNLFQLYRATDSVNLKARLKRAFDFLTWGMNASLELERQGLAHRDIKSSNILVMPNGHFKLADVDYLSPIQEDKEVSFISTPVFTDPYLYASRRHTAESDLYSFGITALNMLFDFDDDHGNMFISSQGWRNYYADELKRKVTTLFQSFETRQRLLDTESLLKLQLLREVILGLIDQDTQERRNTRDKILNMKFSPKPLPVIGAQLSRCQQVINPDTEDFQITD